MYSCGRKLKKIYGKKVREWKWDMMETEKSEISAEWTFSWKQWLLMAYVELYKMTYDQEYLKK